MSSSPPLVNEMQTDRELVELTQKGDPSAFPELVRRHQTQIFRLARRMLGNDADAQEVIQDTFLSAYQKVPEFRGDAAFSSWVYRIAANFALMRLRRRRIQPDGESIEDQLPKFSESGHPMEPVLIDWSKRADDELMDKELGRAIDKAVETLPPDYRVVFLMKDVEGMSNEEIAEMLETSVPAVKSRLHRARLALRAQLGEFFKERQE